MQVAVDRPKQPTAIQTNLEAIFASVELSRSIWLITSLSPGGGEKMSKHSVPAGDIPALLAALFAAQRESACADREILPLHRHSGSWAGRLLASSRIAECRD
jgi:transposase